MQADQASGRNARLVAELYPDIFQIAVRRDSGIDTIGDLVGKRIALPPEKSGEYESFWFLAKHYDLSADDLKVYTGIGAHHRLAAYQRRCRCAVPRARPGDASMLALIAKIDGKVIPIPQAAAIRLQHPALRRGRDPARLL